MGERIKALRQRGTGFQLLMPILIFFILLVANLIIDSVLIANNPNAESFFSIGIVNGNLYGTLIQILNSGSELALLAIGMTLVTAASGGQDISVGAGAAIAGSVFVKIIGDYESATKSDATWMLIIVAFLASAGSAMLCGAFSGTLVAKFRIQPMIATLVLFTAGRSIAYGINGGASPKLFDDITKQIGSSFQGVPIPTPIFIVLIYGIIFFCILRFTNLRLYLQSVGINEKSARLNGLNPVVIKILSFVILGFCVAGAGVINTTRMQRLDHLGILGGIEMDAILAVAIGGNALGGGKFSIVGSVIGAYTIETLQRTLLRLSVAPEAIKAFRAAFIIILVFASSPGVKRYVGKFWNFIRNELMQSGNKGKTPAIEGGTKDA